MAKTVEDARRQFEYFLSATEEARNDAARDRDYVDHKQWTAAEEATLAARGQDPVVVNELKQKVNFLTGFERTQRTDPKALPRTPDSEDAADAATEALRFVTDNVDFDQTASGAFEDKIVWGTEAALIDVEPRPNGDMEVVITQIHSDRHYFDPHSRRKDFSDAMYQGISVWMDVQEVKEQYVTKRGENAEVTADEIDEQVHAGIAENVDGNTFDDAPTWVTGDRKRMRVCQHYFKDEEGWMMMHFTGDLELVKARPSPALDEFDEPACPIEAQSAYITRDGDRYGEVRAYIWIQDEINHRRSKALYQLSVRQTIGDPNAVKDINEAKRQLARADGHVELNVANARFEILENSDLTQGQLAMYQDARNAINAVGPRPELGGDASSAGLSGRAIQALQQGGITELNAVLDGHAAWKRRIYRQVWNRIRHHWTAPKWIRVTDHEDNLKWVGLNQPMTRMQQLSELAEQGDQEAAVLLQEMVAINHPGLNQVVEEQNTVAEMDVDIIIRETPDTAVLRQEQFDQLTQLAQAYGPEEVPFEVMLALSDLPNKDEVRALLEGEEIPPEVQAEQQARIDALADLEIEEKGASARLDEAKARKESAEAEAQEIENAVAKKVILDAETGVADVVSIDGAA